MCEHGEECVSSAKRSAKAFLATEGDDPVYGARPLRRFDQRHLMDPLALRLLQGERQPGHTVTVDANGAGTSVFKTTTPQSASQHPA